MDSPIKNFLQKYSPIKLRDKPLPAPPRPSSRVENPLQPTSGNTSPSKSGNKDNHPKSLFRSLLSRRQPHAPPSPSPPRRQRSPKRSPGGIRKSLRKRTGSQDLGRLSKKVSALEAQLAATKKELKTISTHTSRHPSRPTSVEREQILDAERLRRQLAAVREAEHEGLAEELLQQSYRDRHGVYRSLACKSTDDLGRAIREQEALEEDSSSDDEVDDDSKDPPARIQQHVLHESLRGNGLSNARRSSLRRKSWNHIQATLASERDNDRKRRQETQEEIPPAAERKVKRARRASSFDDFAYARDKELPPIKGSPASFTKADAPSSSMRRVSPPPTQATEPNVVSALSTRPMKAAQPKSHHRTRKSLPNPPIEILQVPKLEPPVESISAQPRKTGHRRKSSLVISQDEVDDALGSSPDRPQTRGKQVGISSDNWTAIPHSPERRSRGGSPSRLERVEEEYEWDEDVF